MTRSDDGQGHEILVRRLRGMGLAVEPLPGGRSALGVLPLHGAALPTAEGSRIVREIRFATVGRGHVKCLAPDWLFPLPMIPVLGCDDQEALEHKIREAWGARLDATRRAARELERRGARSEEEAHGAVLAVPLSLDDPSARARMIEPGTAILPSRGPLAGHPLERAAERVLAVARTPGSAVDLEIEITGRLEQLAGQVRQRAARERTRRARDAGTPGRPAERRAHRVLLVGPRVPSDPRLVEGLRLRGFDVVAAGGAADALRAFSCHSFELVLADGRMGRDDGLELIPALRALAGVDALPVVLVDERMRGPRREAARRAGAAGYLAHPVDLARIGPSLERLLDAPARRRFSRYAHCLAVRCGSHRAHTRALGRLGMFVCTDREAGPGTLERCALPLAELGATLEVEAEVLYTRGERAGVPAGCGLRFHRFASGGEELLIRYLELLEQAAA